MPETEPYLLEVAVAQPAAESDCAAHSVLDGGPLTPDPEPGTLGGCLLRAAELPGAGEIVYLDEAGRPSAQSYAELLAAARTLLRAIRAEGRTEPGDRVLLQVRADRELLAAFWACVLGGLVPVPVTAAPPASSTLTATQLLAGAWDSLGSPWIISDEPPQPTAAHARFRLGSVASLQSSAPAATRDESAEPAPAADPDHVAVLLLTSGSTGLPKAVALTHRNIIARAAASSRVRRLSPANRTFNWMPLDHVGGLVMFHVRDVWLGCHQVHARIGWVLEDPTRWLDAISAHGCDTTWAPNFAFGLVVDRADELAGRSWDLSRLVYVMNGGEAVKPRIARAFLDLLAPYGLPRTAMHPGWGMSETSGGVVDCVFVPSPGEPDERYVSVGVPHPGVTVRVVGRDGDPLPHGSVGALQVRGLPVTSGYVGAGARLQNRQSFGPDGWFKTGDLAVVRDAALTVIGRADDAIETGAVTCFGHEIESAIEELDFVQPAFTVVCPLPADASREPEQPALAVFYHPRDGAGSDARHWQIADRVAQRFGLRVALVRPVRREEVPKTGIGKLRRAQMLRLLPHAAAR